jgi:hypothetical protein
MTATAVAPKSNLGDSKAVIIRIVVTFGIRGVGGFSEGASSCAGRDRLSRL